ncbi:hypothetical protein GCM10007853_01320 [Algimonas ampicilliniresistens]|jgi:hypothetical protein|uniref:DUF937 domain-containing protein n=1 Tax=Algimonas ampicilliniresistens TaxID=1298735 RepID=A0ABQ5V463_9PROT|nr:DUF937 domain-containing protein [Algimonas ampicilliniresistens]GLQ22258.1 hypothetical protein GCM10007853_01320 [Algimonas ampicilliniresistens]
MAMNMMDMIMQAAGGDTAQQAGNQLGLSPQQSQQAIGALLPAISSAMKRNTASPQGLAGLLGALQNGGHEQYLENPQTLSQNAQTDGNAILGHLFGSKDVSRAVAGRASEQTGISSDILKKMLPMVAMMAMGGLSKQTNNNQGIQGMLAQAAMQQLMGGGQQGAPAKGIGGILGGLLGGGGRQQRQQRQAHQQGMGMLGRMLDADGDGNTMDDILGMVMNQR